jgi:hypothetical protein
MACLVAPHSSSQRPFPTPPLPPLPRAQPGSKKV